ncbi:hypothetical protein QE382_001114 [Sphingobacterium zeae]|uniref:Gliding motility protein GldL n=1 Tax=Sphingobacterium zeae TaxID=1776859 RepID=A0ABU0U2G1_9SPHI|nr:hypothetical protein [Sphingobacterium zeae]
MILILKKKLKRIKNVLLILAVTGLISGLFLRAAHKLYFAGTTLLFVSFSSLAILILLGLIVPFLKKT